MSTLTALEKTKLAAYRMPEPFDGQTVLWFPEGKRDVGEYPHFAGIVIRKGYNSLELNVLRPDSKPTHFIGVRHVDDPHVREADLQNGAWDFTEWDKKIMESMKQPFNRLPSVTVSK